MTDPIRPPVTGIPQTTGDPETMESAFHDGGAMQFTRWRRVVLKCEGLDCWQLDHEQRFALCALSGVPIIVVCGPSGAMKFQTARPVTIVKEEGKFKVVMKLPNQKTG